MMKNLFCWLLVAFVAVSCSENEVIPDPIARGMDYYPLAVGDYRVYKVTDIKYQHNRVISEEEFLMREWVVDSFLDQTNVLTYKIIRSVRPDAQSEWFDDSVMTVTKGHSSVILTKDNTKYVKLVFPVKEGKTWLGDMYNDHIIKDDPNPYVSKEVYRYKAIDQPYRTEDLLFEETVTILQGQQNVDPNDPDYLSTYYKDRREIYARGIGKVYRIFYHLKYEPCITEECNTDDEAAILDGHERYEELIEYGKL